MGWTLLALALIFYVGGGWYFSDQLRADGLAVKPHRPEYRARVAQIAADTVTLSQGDPADGDLFNIGRFGLTWDGGYGEVGEVIDQTESEVTRPFVLFGGDLPEVGTAVDVDPWIYPDGVWSAVDLDVEEVEYQSAIGPMDAIFVPGPSDTWAV
ncbi:MAG: hypothetical protein ACRDWH_07000, partial [Acidimicrobiia bacterium]